MASRRLTRSERARLARNVERRLVRLGVIDDVPFREARTWTTEELAGWLEAHGVEINLDVMRQQIIESVGSDIMAVDRGQFMDEPRRQKVVARVEKAIKRTATIAVKQTMRSARQTLIEEADGRSADRRFEIWAAKLRRTCPSCERRHGKVLLADQWILIGRPGDGATICEGDCECSLLPVQGVLAETTRTFEQLTAATNRDLERLGTGG